MAQTDLDQTPSPRRRRSRLWLAVIGVQLAMGLALIAEGAVLYVNARIEGGGPSWLVGALAIVIGAALALPAVYLLLLHIRSSADAEEPGLTPTQNQAIPMLGALLVYKYGVITEEQLETALAEQRKQAEKKRLLGGILLDMGLVTMQELKTALGYQRSLQHKTAESESEASSGSTAEAPQPAGSAAR